MGVVVVFMRSRWFTFVPACKREMRARRQSLCLGEANPGVAGVVPLAGVRVQLSMPLLVSVFFC